VNAMSAVVAVAGDRKDDLDQQRHHHLEHRDGRVVERPVHSQQDGCSCGCDLEKRCKGEHQDGLRHAHLVEVAVLEQEIHDGQSGHRHAGRADGNREQRRSHIAEWELALADVVDRGPADSERRDRGRQDRHRARQRVDAPAVRAGDASHQDGDADEGCHLDELDEVDQDALPDHRTSGYTSAQLQ
jgi:hypothetical protein